MSSVANSACVGPSPRAQQRALADRVREHAVEEDQRGLAGVVTWSR
jgi:hypothetical protein